MVIVSFILMTCIYDQLMILLGEIRCLFLLGLKEDRLIHVIKFIFLSVPQKPPKRGKNDEQSCYSICTL